jgi:16S rRNA G1207 methylase RsmC
MSTDASGPAAPAPPAPTIHEAQLESGSSGAVLRGAEIELAQAVARRQAGQDVVVCGDDTDANRRLAYQVEAAVGPASKPQHPHRRAGPKSLPHFHQRNRKPDGHTFYETDKKKTKGGP